MLDLIDGSLVEDKRSSFSLNYGDGRKPLGRAKAREEQVQRWFPKFYEFVACRCDKSLILDGLITKTVHVIVSVS